MRKLSACFLIIVFAFFMTECTQDSTGGGGTGLYQVTSAVIKIPLFNSMSQVKILVDNNPVADATVTIQIDSGTAINLAYGGSGVYIDMGTVINAGQNVTVNITRGTFTSTETLVMPVAATVTAPTAGSYDASQARPVAWNAVASVDQIGISISSTYTVSSNGYSVSLAGTATTTNIPANTIKPAQSGVTIGVIPTKFMLLTTSGFASASVFMTMNATGTSTVFSTN